MMRMMLPIGSGNSLGDENEDAADERMMRMVIPPVLMRGIASYL